MKQGHYAMPEVSKLTGKSPRLDLFYKTRLAYALASQHVT